MAKKKKKPYDRWKGQGKPVTKYVGVYPSLRRKDGSVLWRASAYTRCDNNNAPKIIIIGSFDDDKEAAIAYDKYVKEHNLPLPTNEEGHRRKTVLLDEDKEYIDKVAGILPTHIIAEELCVHKTLVSEYLEGKNIGVENAVVIILDKRDAYED